MPHVELLYWDGCPSYPDALAELRAVLAELGQDPAGIELREITTDADAEHERFIGSPTIRVDGDDLFVPDPGEPVGLTCRIYRLPDGRVSPTPDPSELREALATALEKIEKTHK